jgi:hypothetical protein
MNATVKVPRVARRVKRRSPIEIDQALADPNLLGAALGNVDSWNVWRSVLRATFGLRLSPEDRERFRSVAGMREPPSRRVDELWAVVGRRSGKTRTASAVACYIGLLEQHDLAVGEIGYVLLLAASRSQASVAYRYVLGFLNASPILRQQIESVTADEVRLKGNVIIGVHTNNFRTVRGKSLLAVIGDESSFWRDETSAQPDVETYRACMPALAATGGIWIGISTGYRRHGLLYTKWRDHFGQESNDVLVIQGGTNQFNPTLSAEMIAKAKAADPEAADSEWSGGWRDDVSSFLDEATVDNAIDHSRPLELPPRDGVQYLGFSDASGGRHDAFTIAIGHREGDKIICDALRGTPAPFNPSDVVASYANLLKDYRVTKLRGDNYSAAWVETAWRAHGITYERAELNKSQIYLESLPLFVRGLIAVPNLPALSRELRMLERRTSRSSKEVVDHPRNQTDDYANSLCGLAQMLSARPRYRYDSSMNWIYSSEKDDGDEFKRLQRVMHMTRRW